MSLKNKKIFYVSGITVVFLILLLIFLLLTTSFVPLEPDNLDSIKIVSDGECDYVLVQFADHPPWSHSRFFIAEYDFQQRKIILMEYYQPFHLFSKSIHSSNVIVLNKLEGKYKIFLGKSFIGYVVYSGKNIEWFPETP
jgi:hypothetical protein